MGEVYEAEDLVLPERVALKTIHAPDATQDASLERFRREIHLARQITHPNICRVHDVFTYHTPAGPTLFLSMELLPGETLAERLRRASPLTLIEIGEIARQVALALAAMHRAKVVHRDLKSSNVMLVPDEREPSGIRAVVMDFGLARHSVALESAALTGNAHLLSLGTSAYLTAATGTFMGTPAYLAPEQIEGGPIGSWTDIYAFGVVLFEAVCGRLPFEGATPVDLAFQRLTQPPPEPRALVPTLPHGWGRIILRCLERSPEERFSSADEVLDELEKLTTSGKRSPTLGRVEMKPRNVLTFVLVAAVVGGIVPYLWSPSPSASTTRADPPAPRESGGKTGTNAAVTPATIADVTATLLRLSRNALNRGDFQSSYEALREAADSSPNDTGVRNGVDELWSSVEGEVKRLGPLAGGSSDPRAAAAISEGKKLAEGGRRLEGVAALLRAHALMASPTSTPPLQAGRRPDLRPPQSQTAGSSGDRGAVLTVELSTTPAPVSAARVAPSQEDLARRVLDSGRAFLRDRKYTEAMGDFQFVVDRFPSSSVADEAAFEIARYESSARANMKRAIEAEARPRSQLPDSDSAPSAGLQLARTAFERAQYDTVRDLLDTVVSRSSTSTITKAQRQVIIESYSLRALASLALRDVQSARSDLRAMLLMSPSAVLPPQADPRASELFAEVRAATVRDVRFAVRPEDADVRLVSNADGRTVSVRLTEPRVVPLVIGSSHTVVASRTGYGGVTISFIVEPGVTEQVIDLVLGGP
jgi:serine/threonine protein kinase/TolA-binding protein